MNEFNQFGASFISLKEIFMYHFAQRTAVKSFLTAKGQITDHRGEQKNVFTPCTYIISHQVNLDIFCYVACYTEKWRKL